MTLPRSIRLIAFLLFVLVVPTAQAQEAPLTGFDDYINKALRDWELPGLAIAIVKNDQLDFAKGYGIRKLGDPAPVNERTLFAIGSSSKAFTAAAVAMLVDEGKIKWDSCHKVPSQLPTFRFACHSRADGARPTLAPGGTRTRRPFLVWERLRPRRDSASRTLPQAGSGFPGNPVYDLSPVTPTRFCIDGAPEGFFVQFEMAEGKVKSLTLMQGSCPSFVLLPK
jgi:hypothetical protein